MQCHRIHVLLDDTTMTPHLAGALDRIGAEPVVTALAFDSELVVPAACDARIVLTDQPLGLTSEKQHDLLAWFDRDPCATLILSDAPVEQSAVSASAYGTRPIAVAANLSVDELAGRLSAMCTFRACWDQVRRELDSARRAADSQRRRIGRLDEQLRSASTLQRSLCRTVPTVRGAGVRTIDRPAETLSGDICDVARITDSKICITLADVTDHGLTSALLAAHLKRSLQGDGHRAGRTGHTCPAQILRRTNGELLESAPPDCQFVTAVVAVFDEDTQVLRWARGGAPYPILLRPGRPPQLLKSDGPLLGVVLEPDFEVSEVQLEPGDLVIFHTDGLETCTSESPEELCSHLLESESGATSPLGRVIAGIESCIASHQPTEATDEAGLQVRDDVSVVALSVSRRKLTPLRPHGSYVDSARVAVTG